jgi:hypothetical protein
MMDDDEIIVIQNAYAMPDKYIGYAVKFGNAYYGYFTKNPNKVCKMWAMDIRQSQGKYPGDVTLFKNGKLIRGLNNGHTKILDKNTRYVYHVNKY